MVRHWRVAIALVLVGLVMASVIFERLPAWIALVYAIMGVVSLIAYGSDKRYAVTGQWRTSEAALHGFDFCCGIIGGLLGQAIFRHKTRKPRFVTATAVIAAVHVLWVGAFAAGLLDLDSVGTELARALDWFDSLWKSVSRES